MYWFATIFSFLILLVSLALFYDQATKHIPSRLREDQAPRSGFGFVAVDGFGSRPNANGLDIIFVHGLGSNPDTTWRSRRKPLQGGQERHIAEESVCWVTDFLPEEIPPATRRYTRVFFYNHDSYWQRNAVQTGLWNLAQDMLHHLSSEIRKSPEERGRGLIFVGHSYGGLLVKQALVQASRNPVFEEIARQTRAVVFLGTPHAGSNFTDWGTIIAKALQPLGSNASILDEIAYDSALPHNLHREFTSVIGDNIRVVNFFEQRKVCLFRVWFLQWNQFCVREGSATYTGSPKNVQNIGLGVDHYNLNKFGSKTREYKIVVAKLVELLGPTPQPWHSVPLRTVPSYTTRHLLSSVIEEKLQVPFNNSDILHALIIHGLGGAGKTQLALKFIEDHKEEYSPILWINAQSVETVLSSFERCANMLHLPVDKTSTQELTVKTSPAIESVLRWLRDSRGEWLLVIDNADDPGWDVEEIVPRGERGSVIITSQHPQSPRLLNNKCERIEVGMMDLSEASHLLLKHLNWQYDSTSGAIRNVCRKIVERLGGLALALDLAGAYLGEQTDPAVALEQYLIDYDRHQDDLLQSGSFYRLFPYEKTVWTVWETSLTAIEKRYPKTWARLVLAFLAHFDRGNIQDELFRLASLGFPILAGRLCLRDHEFPDWLKELISVNCQEWDSFHYRKALDPLIRYSLLQRVDETWPGVTMHGLVQWRAGKHQSDQPWDLWVSIFISAVCQQMVRERETPQFRRYVIPHIPAIGKLGYRKSISVDNSEEERNGVMWSHIGKIYHDEGWWKEAEELQVQVMEMNLRMLGQEHPDTLAGMSNLASTFWNQGRWKEAEVLEVQVVETSLRVLGQEHPDTLNGISNLASTYRSQGRWKEAEELDVQVMERRKRVLGEEHPNTLTGMASLASTYWNQGRLKEAKELQVQVMETSLRVLGQEHPDTLTSMANLASTFWNQGWLKEAEVLEVQVMETSLRVLGQEHPDTLTSMSNLSSTYRSQGRWKEAEELDVQVMERRKRVLGEEHPDMLTSMASLASTFWNQGRLKEAEELQVQVMERRKRVLGQEHPDTLTSMANLASIYGNQGRWKEAEVLEVQVVETSLRVLGQEHPDTLAGISNLASTYRSQGRWKEAEELDMQVMETNVRVLGQEHPDTLTDMVNLASTFWN